MKQVPLRHFLNTQDWKRDELDAVLALSAAYKQRPLGLRSMEGKSIALVFFNSSLRTRTSFEIGAFQLGGHAVVLQPGKDAWPRTPATACASGFPSVPWWRPVRLPDRGRGP